VSEVKAQTSNGPIAARGALRQINLQTSNGPITVDGGSGTIDVETSNGPVDVTAEDAVVVAAPATPGPLQWIAGARAQ